MESPIFCFPKAQNRTNRPARSCCNVMLLGFCDSHAYQICSACGRRIGMCGYTSVPEDGRVCFYLLYYRRCCPQDTLPVLPRRAALYTEGLSTATTYGAQRLINRTGLTSWTFTRWRDLHTSDKVAHYSIYRPQKDERLSWPSWLTYSGGLTHVSGHPSAAGRAWDKESTPVKDQCTVQRNQPIITNGHYAPATFVDSDRPNFGYSYGLGAETASKCQFRPGFGFG